MTIFFSGLGTLVKCIKSTDESVIGNAALCLGHCTQVPKVCAALTKTDIMKDLLVLARDGKRPQLQQNCAILIAKLAQGDTRFVSEIQNHIFKSSSNNEQTGHSDKKTSSYKTYNMHFLHSGRDI